ncbi:hypothetical protein BAU07_25280 [Bordetella flabilis]|uniref:Uncharacterized protein n=1 Tax=Bordetella flabilis TaxID=463014 RepID=A0A193GIS5_9BORD|nr:hypothetical protein BAU07_25280 [Bordetella flabilis]
MTGPAVMPKCEFRHGEIRPVGVIGRVHQEQGGIDEISALREHFVSRFLQPLGPALHGAMFRHSSAQIQLTFLTSDMNGIHVPPREYPVVV